MHMLTLSVVVSVSSSCSSGTMLLLGAWYTSATAFRNTRSLHACVPFILPLE